MKTKLIDWLMKKKNIKSNSEIYLKKIYKNKKIEKKSCLRVGN